MSLGVSHSEAPRLMILCPLVENQTGDKDKGEVLGRYFSLPHLHDISSTNFREKILTNPLACGRIE